jgi:hypothetical protein
MGSAFLNQSGSTTAPESSVTSTIRVTADRPS